MSPVWAAGAIQGWEMRRKMGAGADGTWDCLRQMPEEDEAGGKARADGRAPGGGDIGEEERVDG